MADPEHETESSVVIPEEEFQRIVREKMCVLRSLSSVARAFTQQDYTLTPALVSTRLAHMDSVEKTANTELQEWLESQRKLGRNPHPFDFQQVTDQVRTKLISEDRLNIKKMIKSVANGKDIASPLELALEPLTARFETVSEYSQLLRALKNPANQVCVILPGHMAHFGLSADGNLVSLSDVDSNNKPIVFDDIAVSLMMFHHRKIYSNENYNIVIFTKEEKVPDESGKRIDDTFLDTNATDPDFVTVTQRVESYGDQPIYPPLFFKVEEHIYPEVTNYREEGRRTAAIQKPEAVACGYLARKLAVLESNFAMSFDVSSKMQDLYIKQAEILDMKLPVGNIWQKDVSDGIKFFLMMINPISQVREKMEQELAASAAPPPRESRFNFSFFRRKKVPNIREVFWDRYNATFKDPLMEDEFAIGEHTTQRIVEQEMENLRESLPKNPGGARTEDEIQARIRSRELGLQIARSFYLKSLALAA